MPAEAAPSLLWLPELGPYGAVLPLGEDDSHYLTRVCRARSGDRVAATDGRGTLATLCVIETRGGARVRVEALESVPDLGRARVACGAPEGQRADWLVEKLAELGVRAMQPLDLARGSWERFDARRERLERMAIAALRQSRRAWRMEILAPRPLREWLETLPGGEERWLADPAGRAPEGIGASAEAIAVVGPAGGLERAEREALERARFAPVRLSTARLRTETAALAWAALWAVGRARPGTSTSS